MTREEAIKWLNDYLQNTPFQMEQYEKAFVMAIQALSQESCDDVISREAVYSILNEYHIGEEEIDSAMDECQNLTVNAITSDVSLLPSVTQKPKTGHWIYDEIIENWRCSKCDETPKTMGYVGTADFMAEHFKFCNHCGAKMESEDKE